MINFNEKKSNYNWILNGIIFKIKTYLDQSNLKLDMKVETQLTNFLFPLVDNRVWIMLESEMPTSDEYFYKNILVQNHILKLAYGSNVADGKFPNLLYVSLEEAYELSFRKFWLDNYLPLNLLEEALPLLDLHQHITIFAYERASQWRQMLSTAKNFTIIGQKMDPETGAFVEKRPIGYVSGNTIVITAPNERMDYTGNSYEFN